jgi:Tol biopolymer transport system component
MSTCRREGDTGWRTPGEEVVTGPLERHGQTGLLRPRYRILGLIGAGGMGVVYRAEDTQLGRTVALKFLPPTLTPDPYAKLRFVDEARAASALDHPNLCTVYEIGRTAEGQLYIAMPCYEGETLQRRLERGPLPVWQSFGIALQVARGLASAHRHGIVHRDVKPANLMITSDGVVKVLDFGIAKLPHQAAFRPSLGTPAYMSPEQARGGDVDMRSDVWSLGVVLYEMLTGRRPPEVDEPGAVAADLERMRTARGGRLKLPPGTVAVLARMLARDAAARYADAGALLDDLAVLARSAAAGRMALPLPPVRGEAAAAARRPRPLRVPALLSVPAVIAILAVVGVVVAVAVAAVALAAGAVRWLHPQGGGGAGAPLRATLTRLTDVPGRAWFPSLSPDGSLVAYARLTGEGSRLFLQRVDDVNALALLGGSPQGETQPAFSPDGRWIAFRSERDGGGIFVMSAGGGSVRRVSSRGWNPAWSPSGREILYATEGVEDPHVRRQSSRLVRCNLATGEQRVVVAGDAVQPSWSPHGWRIAYWGVELPRARRLIWTVLADPADPADANSSAAPVPVTKGASLDWNPVWSPDGRVLYFVSDRSGIMNLWRVAIDERSGRVLGEPEPVTTSAQAGMMPSIASSGRSIAFAGDDSLAVLEAVAFDPVRGVVVHPAVGIYETKRLVLNFDASPDGRWLAFATAVPREDIWMVHPDGSGLRQLVGDGYKNRQPSWSPDGRRLAFYTNRSGRWEIWTVRADGSGLAPAGRRLAFDMEEDEALIDLARAGGGRSRAVMLPPPPAPPGSGGLRFSASSWSPDGRWLAGILHQPDGPRTPGIVLYSPAHGRFVRVADRGWGPCWLPDSRRLLYWDDKGLFLLDTRSRRSRLVLAAAPGSYYNDLSPSADGRVLYLARIADVGDIWLLTFT